MESPGQALADQSVSELLDAVGARTPAPGGGTCAAVGAALGACLVEMAARFTGGREEVAGEAAVLRSQLLALGERELTAYEPVLEAFARDPGDPDRESRLREALSDAADSPLEIARAAAVVASLGAELAVAGNTNLTGDAMTAVALAEAACCAAARLTEINLARVPSDPRLDEAAELARQASAARAKALGGMDGTQSSKE